MTIKSKSMDGVIEKHFAQKIVSQKQLMGGYTFNTWLLCLSKGQKVVFRYSPDFATGSGREIIIADVFRREKFFYDSVNAAIGHICPEVYVIDETKENFETSFQIAEYLEGTTLDLCFDNLSDEQKSAVHYRHGEIAAGVNKLEIDEQHPYILSRGTWKDFFATRLEERLTPLVELGLITAAQIESILGNVAKLRIENKRSFLHLDMRFANMIYNEGNIFLIDAENSEFGDPLFELAVFDINDYLTPEFLSGYTNVSGAVPDLSSELFNFYKLERLALILYVFIVEADDEKLAKHFLRKFEEVKSKVL